MSLLLALGGAIFYGAGDFAGGFASKRFPAWGVMAASQTIGLGALGAGLILFPAENVTAVDLVWGAAAGVGGAIGIGLLYRALAEGTMAVVSPVTAATTGAIPVAADLATGGGLGLWSAVGVVLALIAIFAVAGEKSQRRLEPRLLATALAAGTGFALFFIFIAQTSEESGFWPLVGARAVTIPMGFLLHRILEPRIQLDASGLKWVAAAGLLDMGANLLIAAALQRGPLGIVSVLSSLYPIVTAVLAMLLLKERLSSTQVLAVALAMVAVVLLVL